jgi:DNA polymerase
LGATAAQAILGRDFRITTGRGRMLASPWEATDLATYHPSAILRTPDERERRRIRSLFFEDLETAAGAQGGGH